MTLKEVFELNGSKFPFRAKCESKDPWWERCHKGKPYITFTHIDPIDEEFYICSELDTPCVYVESTDWLPVEDIQGKIQDLYASGQLKLPCTVSPVLEPNVLYEVMEFDKLQLKFKIYITKYKTVMNLDGWDIVKVLPGE